MTLADANSEAWLAQNNGFRTTALTYLMRRVLEGEEPVPGVDGATRTVAEGFVSDVVSVARKGNPTAMSIVFDRMEGKVPNTSVNVNATFTDDERISRILGIVRRGRATSSSGEPDSSGESGA